MRKIILDLAVTLDGFIEGPNGEIDWIDMQADESEVFENFLDEVDTIFYGRVSYELWGNYQPDENASPFIKELYRSIHDKEKIVFSSTKKGDGKATYINADLEQHVQEIRNKPGKDIWLYGGGSLITAFMERGLVDEYRLAVYPVILGQGKPLFNNIHNRVNLTLQRTVTSKSGVILLCYEARR